jgi:hypothetical protein
LNTLQRGAQVHGFDHEFHDPGAASRVCRSLRRRRRCSPGRGRFVCETHGDLTLRLVRPFPDVDGNQMPAPGTTASADFSPTSPLSTTLPFQARDEISRSKTCVVLRATAASTTRDDGCWSFAVSGPLAPPSPPHTRFLSIGPRFCSPLPSRRPHVRRSAVRSGRYTQLPGGLSPPPRRSCSAHQRVEGPRCARTHHHTLRVDPAAQGLPPRVAHSVRWP